MKRKDVLSCKRVRLSSRDAIVVDERVEPGRLDRGQVEAKAPIRKRWH
jgi:hypothetical protein